MRREGGVDPRHPVHVAHVILRHRAVPALHAREHGPPADAEQGGGLVMGERLERRVVEGQAGGIQGAAGEDPQEHVARRGPPRKLRAREADRQDAAAGAARHHDARRVEGMGDVVPPEAEHDHRRAGVLDAAEIRRQPAVDAGQEPRRRRRGGGDHDRVGRDGRRRVEGHRPAAGRMPGHRHRRGRDEPHAARGEPLSEPPWQRLDAGGEREKLAVAGSCRACLGRRPQPPPLADPQAARLPLHRQEFGTRRRHAQTRGIRRPDAGGERLDESLEHLAAEPPHGEAFERLVVGAGPGSGPSDGNERLEQEPHLAGGREQGRAEDAAPPAGREQAKALRGR